MFDIVFDFDDMQWKFVNEFSECNQTLKVGRENIIVKFEEFVRYEKFTTQLIDS